MWWYHGFWAWGALAMTVVMVGLWVVVFGLLIATHSSANHSGGPWAPPRRHDSRSF